MTTDWRIRELEAQLKKALEERDRARALAVRLEQIIQARG